MLRILLLVNILGHALATFNSSCGACGNHCREGGKDNKGSSRCIVVEYDSSDRDYSSSSSYSETSRDRRRRKRRISCDTSSSSDCDSSSFSSPSSSSSESGDRRPERCKKELKSIFDTMLKTLVSLTDNYCNECRFFADDFLQKFETENGSLMFEIRYSGYDALKKKLEKEKCKDMDGVVDDLRGVQEETALEMIDDITRQLSDERDKVAADLRNTRDADLTSYFKAGTIPDEITSTARAATYTYEGAIRKMHAEQLKRLRDISGKCRSMAISFLDENVKDLGRVMEAGLNGWRDSLRRAAAEDARKLMMLTSTEAKNFDNRAKEEIKRVEGQVFPESRRLPALSSSESSSASSSDNEKKPGDENRNGRGPRVGGAFSS
jgi:hypothetical protein